MWQKAIFLIKERRHVGLLQQGKVLRLVSRFTITPFFVSLSAWLALAPSVLYYFHRVSPLAVPLNIIVVPLVGIILTIGFIAFLISPISLSVAKGVSFLNVGLLSACAKIVEVSSCARFVALDVSCIPSLLVFMYYGVGVILVFYLRQRLIPHSEESPA
jgi:competence protein ComEC